MFLLDRRARPSPSSAPVPTPAPQGRAPGPAAVPTRPWLAPPRPAALARAASAPLAAPPLAAPPLAAPPLAAPPLAAPPLTADRLRYFFGENRGRPLATPERRDMETGLGVDYGAVRVHDDAASDALARSAQAEAFTFGDHVVLRSGATSSPRRELLAHELVHHAQQQQHAGATPAGDTPLRLSAPGDAAEIEADSIARDVAGARAPAIGAAAHAAPSPGTLARVPAAPTDASGGAVPFDRSKATVTGLPASAMAVSVASSVTLGPFIATPSFAMPGVNHLTFELYDPNDKLVDSLSTTKTSAKATTEPFVITGNKLTSGKVPQGRYLVRLIGQKDSVPIVHSDTTFYVWTQQPTSWKGLADLNAIKSKPGSHGFGDVGAAHARAMMLEHQQAVAATGVGTVQGNQCTTAAPKGSAPALHDCTTYVLEILKATFTAKGKSADWNTIFADAQKRSGGAFKGTALLESLVAVGGWKAVFWSPDPRNPADSNPEHPTAYKTVKKSGTYYNIPVDKAQSVVDYRPTSATKQESMTQLDKLRQVPLAVIAAKGGRHMTLLLNGDVYEVHWDKPVTDPDVIEATPLERWAWNSGVVVMPDADYKKAFGP
ncbi:eCIS core domain-containing protein [Sorangium sp. So ce854]|uniref:eCIS core domain-containing protein n=1 Tax=Sorangium sp. So ce854 TaxID=3133322 RepID=UPI003F5F73FA